ncbi:hypothetical protein PPYR_01368 [Photinus pyralis]|uniref:C2H2-type domain-containing protein n=1 Tax=Photinus pyralis TaxID=7054 RepID=A0A1Y1MCC0_PHOPY|nr:hypothetical protein PPYR_14863 [Photinus pyralis]KAB0804398.1 hypothetical protein PPYR_01368 [Photinus pyralis]
MPQCYKCKQNAGSVSNQFDGVDELIKHFKLFHSFTPYGNFYCLDCCHTYQSLKAFKRHFKGNNKSCINKSSDTINRLEKSYSQHENNTDSSVGNSERENVRYDLASALKNIEATALIFVTKLYSKSNYARKDVDQLINDITNNLLGTIITELSNIFNTTNNNNGEIDKLLAFCLDPFCNFNTYHKYTKSLQNRDLYREPKIFETNNEVDHIILNSTPCLDSKSSKGALMPLQFQFQKFFELPNVLKDTIENMTNLAQKSTIHNIINGEIWKQKKAKFENKTLIPYILYFDDFEINNALGSHAGSQSIAAFYYSFPTLPQHHVSSLENIFTALLFKSTDKCYGNDATLNLLIKEIQLLEKDGLMVHGHQIHYILMAIVGDNLGLNSILGFTKSFSANFPCRFCKCNQSEIKSDCQENLSKFRTIENYQQDISNEIEVKNRAKQSGIREISIFNTIDSFHVVNNYAVDIMHDLFEGVCHYDVCQILTHLIEKDHLFSLKILNSRKQLFNYGKTEIGNISPPIKINHLTNLKLHMSAREMWTFCHFLPLIIGDLVPINNKYWKLLRLLLEMIDLILMTEFNDTDLKLMTLKIEQHHLQYVKLFGNTLKPKFHFLLHYPTIIKKIGPLKYIWCFRFESKHRELKMYTNNTNSRKNIPYTIGIKCSLKFSYRLLNNNGFKNIIAYNSKSTKQQNLRDQFYYKNLNLDAVNIIGDDIMTFKKDIIYKGTQYAIDYYLLTKKLQLYRIVDIVLTSNENIYFVCSQYKLGNFCNHFQSYLLPTTESTDTFFMFSPSHFDYYSPLHTYMSPNGKTYVRPKYF